MKSEKATPGMHFRGFAVKIGEKEISIQRNLTPLLEAREPRGGVTTKPRLRYTNHSHGAPATPMGYPKAAMFVDWASKSSSNSPYAGQDLNASGSYSSCQQPAEASSKTQSTESYRALERRLEREREKRTHGEGSSSRLESKGLSFRTLGLHVHVPPATSTHPSPRYLSPIRTSPLLQVLPEEPSPQAMDSRRNGFRLSTNPKSPTTTRSTGAAAEPSTASSGSFRTASNRDALSSMGSLTVASTPSSAALRGHSIGFGSRDVGVRSPTQRSRTRGGMVMPMTLNDKMKNTRYLFVDPVPSASPSFQQRLSELAALESDTIRYERTKRIKKRSKQENQ
ncbi:uncharacterized protein LOC119729189 isoform X3 [Patiria miniata]|uniref:Uncharacterized protein n=1 Tax=Patiria miniata TaxID=46514 RepID=A0A914A1Z0_PATMI|nr:uncharacterized protein LOC119729189 isoform X3 [Patiria miniata]XP_038057661.1 uncharacterized protein LOC119729189 isoform X3 [Patiria miniata]